MLFLRSIIDNLFNTEKQTAGDLASFRGTWDCDQSSRVESLKLPSRFRTLCEPMITIHCTDVRGGFGVAPKHAHRFEDALLDRYAHVAYHAIASRRLGAVHNHSIHRRTSHGNAGNRGVGFAADCAHDEPLTPELATATFRALCLLVGEVYALTGEIVQLVPHRAFSAQRRNDPGPHVWEIVKKVALVSRAEINYTLAEDKGLPVPSSWDDQALFDFRGRRLMSQ